MKRIFFCLNFFILTLLLCFSTILKPVGEYLFHQQLDDGCRVIPMLNRAKLERLGNNVLNAPWYEWLTNREYLGENFAPYHTWMNSLESIITNPSSYPNLYKYLKDAIIKGPVAPHLYDKNGNYATKVLSYYDENNSPVYFDDPGELLYAPYFFIDYGGILYNDTLLNIMVTAWDLDDKNEAIRILKDDLPAIALRIPLGKEKDGTAKLYNTVTKTYDTVTIADIAKPSGKCGYSYPINIKDDVKLPSESDLFVKRFEKYQNLHQLGGLRMAQPTKYDEEKNACVLNYPLGFAEICELIKLPMEMRLSANEAGSGINIFGQKTDTSYFSPESQGRTKLLFLRLGIDEDNKIIRSGHALNGAYSDFKKLCNTIPNHPWRDELCDRSYFLQYQIAQAFINDQKLYASVQDILPKFAEISLGTAEGEPQGVLGPALSWERYNKFMNKVKNGEYYRDKKNTPYIYKDVKQFLLGPEQMLAFAISNIVRIAWYGAVNPQAQAEAIGKDVTFDILKTALTKKHSTQGTQKSFIDLWQQIISAIKKQTAEKNLISLEDHGWLLSFDQTLIDKQATTAHDGILLKSLGCVAIESIFSSSLPNAFYRRNRPDLPKLRAERSRILMVEELAKQLENVFRNDPDKLSAIKKTQPEIVELKEANDAAKQLSSTQLQKLTDIENNLKPQKVLVDGVAKKMGEIFRKILEERKKRDQTLDHLALALKGIKT